MQSKFIVVEGIDGVGKSIITVRVCRRLNELGAVSVSVKSPVGDYALSKSYVDRRCDVDSHYLYYLGGVKHTSDVVRKLLKTHTVVCDRYIYTTEAYHRAAALSVSVDLSTLGLLEPHHKFYITVSDENVRRARISRRGGQAPGDEEVREKGSLLQRIEREFEGFELVRIDNTYRTLDEVIEDIVGRVMWCVAYHQ